MNKLNLSICAAILIFLTLSCSMMKDSKAVGPAVEKFHAQFNEQQFSQIYRDSGDQMKEAATEKQLTDLLDAVHRKLGTVQKSAAASWHVNSGPLSSTVTTSYDTQFTEGKATEQFVFSVQGETVKLIGYNINSTDLITK